MKLVVFVEEESAAAALKILLPRLAPSGCATQVINLQNKSELLKNIESRLIGFAPLCAKEDIRFAVLVDRDQDDCLELKKKLETAARKAGLSTPSNPQGDGSAPFRVINRIVIEELESWFLGDPEALRKAYPKLPRLDARKSPFRNPDNGGSWETLERVLRSHGYRDRYKKIDGARRIAQHMQPDANASGSFKAFREGLSRLLQQTGPVA